MSEFDQPRCILESQKCSLGLIGISTKTTKRNKGFCFQKQFDFSGFIWQFCWLIAKYNCLSSFWIGNLTKSWKFIYSQKCRYLNLIHEDEVSSVRLLMNKVQLFFILWLGFIYFSLKSLSQRIHHGWINNFCIKSWCHLYWRWQESADTGSLCDQGPGWCWL